VSADGTASGGSGGSGGGDGWAVWGADRQQRLALAADPTGQSRLLEAWSFTRYEGLTRALLGGLEIPDSEDTARLVGWVFGPAPRGDEAPGSLLQRDLQALSQAEPRRGDATQRRTAGLYLLGRLGEELARREHRAWREQRWQHDPRDAEARRFWELALGTEPSVEAGLLFRHLWGAEVKRAFRGVCMSVGLSSGFAHDKADEACEQLDLVCLGMHRDLAARVIETGGEPVEALSHSLGPSGLAGAWAAIRQRLSWERARQVLTPQQRDVPPGLFSAGADLVVFQRLIAHLRSGQARPHHLGLPGWGVVAANRARIRGRLRALAAREPSGLAGSVLDLDTLWSRTAAATGRHAWEWAWREARVGFGFHPDRMQAAPCVVGQAPDEATEPLGPDHERAVVTFLLSILARDCWDTLERWLQGASGRSLGGSFYRHLSRIPDNLRQPGQRAYHRLWEHLSDGGIDHYLPRVEAVAQRVCAAPDGRGSKPLLHTALRPDWDDSLIALPQHHLTTLRRSFERFISAGGPLRSPGGEP
jgi:hypothetical protein